MIHKNDRWLDQTGLNLIRIVIGSYFMGVSLDLVVGVDQRALFMAITTPQFADLIGSTLLFSISAAFMTGIYLRLSALMLALFLLCSSLVQNFLHFDLANISGFWRDITLACAVMLNYSNLGRRELRRASVIARRRARAHRRQANGDEVTPRRIEPALKSKRRGKTAFTPPAAFVQHQTARRLAAAGAFDTLKMKSDAKKANAAPKRPSFGLRYPANSETKPNLTFRHRAMAEVTPANDDEFYNNIFANV